MYGVHYKPILAISLNLSLSLKTPLQKLLIYRVVIYLMGTYIVWRSYIPGYDPGTIPVPKISISTFSYETNEGFFEDYNVDMQ